jgi:prefoldin subunit 5
MSYNLISAVQSSSDASSTITNHINDLNQAITSLTQQSRTYQSQIEQSQSKLSDCSSDKKIADTAVISAINTNKLENINTLIQTSVTAGQCETQHRVTINALTLITKKYTQAITSLTKKANLIEQHKGAIAQYPEVISDPAIIKELSQISSQF